MNSKDREIVSFIKVIRESFAEAKIVYCYGACYSFYKILKKIYPEAIAHTTKDNDNWEEGGHIISKIGNNYFDITGIVNTKECIPQDKPLSEKEHCIWDANVFGMRAEHMIKRRFK